MKNSLLPRVPTIEWKIATIRKPFDEQPAQRISQTTDSLNLPRRATNTVDKLHCSSCTKTKNKITRRHQRVNQFITKISNYLNAIRASIFVCDLGAKLQLGLMNHLELLRLLPQRAFVLDQRQCQILHRIGWPNDLEDLFFLYLVVHATGGDKVDRTYGARRSPETHTPGRSTQTEQTSKEIRTIPRGLGRVQERLCV